MDAFDFARETAWMVTRHPRYDLAELREVVLDISRSTPLAAWAALDQVGWWLERDADLSTVRAWYLRWP